MAVRIESQAEPIPGYKLLERIGGGGFGEVWKAIAPGGLHKAIKFVYGDLETAGDEGMRAEQELKAMSRVKSVRHPYILSLERFDIVEGQLMIVMELADRNLWDRFRECRSEGQVGIPREEMLRYMEECAEALDLMNIEYQLQHLDIKPQNLFLVHNHVKVADFGLVKDLEGMAASVTGGVTPVYAAPETFDGWVSRYCDQYSLAIVYQELLTGQRPFAGTNVRQLIMQHLQGTPNLSSLPGSDQPIIARALSKSPDDRFPTCAEMVKLLRAGGGLPVAVATKPEAAEARPTVTGGDTDTPERPLPQRPRADQISEVLPPTESRADVRAQAPAAPWPAPPPKPEPSGQGQVDPDQDTRRLRTGDSGQRQLEAKPARMAPEEPPGEGILFPALVVGLGEIGLRVLQRLRKSLNEQVGASNAWPHVRLLGLDTDPETARAVTTDREVPLALEEVLVARLGRPSHYIKPRDGKSRLNSWFEQKMLYRIPRTPVTAGLRALGRLAFVDHYGLISSRLQKELEACSDREVLETAARQTNLGLRSRHPRVYVIASLSGGTGSGMFLDLAYVIRQQLKGLGYAEPELVGLFFLPTVDAQPTRTLTLGNAYAALTELNHFSGAGASFVAQYREREPALRDSAAPFARWLALALPATKEPGALDEVTGMAAQYLSRELVTPVGKLLDEQRAETSLTPGRSPRLLCHSVGLYRLSWPRAALINRVARQLCRRIVQRWITRDSAPVKPAVEAWVAELWANQDLGAESLIAQLQEACAKALKKTPEALFDAAVASLPAGAEQQPGFIASVADALKEIERIVGRPGDVSGGPALMTETLDQAASGLVAACGQQLAEVAVQLMELPEFRLAGAEEALRQVVVHMEQALQSYEPLNREMASRSAEAYSRLQTLLTNPSAAASGKRKEVILANLPELVRTYGKWRYQSLVLQRVLGIFVSMRGYLSDQLREINFCRARLGDLARSFENVPETKKDDTPNRRGRSFFPAGCQSLNEAAQQLLDAVTDDDLRELDRRIQDEVQRRFTALVHVCLASANVVKDLGQAMEEQAEAFAGARLAGTDVAEMYLRHDADEAQTEQALAADFEHAVPAVSTLDRDASDEICILAAPESSAGQRLVSLARKAVPEVHLDICASSDDILFCREVVNLPVSSLDQLGPIAYEAYRRLASAESFSPHSRIDITEWRGPTPVEKR